MNKTCEIEIGKIGKIEFKKGHYVYVGSAMNSLTARIKRHLSDEKKLHWHIDYLLKNGNSEVIEVICNVSEEKIECELSQLISQKNEGVASFGCSDCQCESHLYYFENRKEAIECVKNAYDSIAMEYKFFNR